MHDSSMKKFPGEKKLGWEIFWWDICESIRCEHRIKEKEKEKREKRKKKSNKRKQKTEKAESIKAYKHTSMKANSKKSKRIIFWLQDTKRKTRFF